MNAGSKIKVFLSYGSEDREVAERLARDLTQGGVETFFADWEIHSGDSIRTKLDQALGSCTHFVVLLTPGSIAKPWVVSEMDAGFVRRIEDGCTFIPLRRGLPHESLPPLLRGLHSPVLDDYDPDLRTLLGYLHGVERRPQVGLRPGFATPGLPPGSPVSLAASRIVEVMVKESKLGRWNDPTLSAQDLESVGLTAEELLIATEELEDLRLVERIGGEPFGFALRPTNRLFAEHDGVLMPWQPSDDARCVVASLVNDNRKAGRLDVIAHKLGWSLRRLNPAVTYLIDHDLAFGSKEISSHLVVVEIHLRPRASRWLREP